MFPLDLPKNAGRFSRPNSKEAGIVWVLMLFETYFGLTKQRNRKFLFTPSSHGTLTAVARLRLAFCSLQINHSEKLKKCVASQVFIFESLFLVKMKNDLGSERVAEVLPILWTKKQRA